MHTSVIHVKPPRCWMNDPNGFIFYKGQYHLFYQHFPYEPRWGTMHWGHAVSRDLVRWEHLDIALFPSKYDDRNGCFSGTALEEDGQLFLYYTGVRYPQENPEDIHTSLDGSLIAAQMMMTSPDGFHFDNRKQKRTVISPIRDPELGSLGDTRDPKVWRGKDGWYLMLGTKTPDSRGKLLFYKSADLFHWSFVNSFSAPGGAKSLGKMWECPDYFQAGDSQILILSAMWMFEENAFLSDKCQPICMPVDFREETCSMAFAGPWQRVDLGTDFYAPQTNVDAQGRRVCLGWLRMIEPSRQNTRGMLCAPRVVEAKNGHIYFRLHPDVRSAFRKELPGLSLTAPGGCRLELSLENGEELNLGGLKLRRENDCLYTDRSAVFAGLTEPCLTFQTPVIRGGTRLEILAEENLAEIFVNDGEYVLSHVVYGLTEKLRTNAASGVRITGVEPWQPSPRQRRRPPYSSSNAPV